MRRSSQAVLAGAAALTAAAVPARADHTSVHATVVGNLAGTDNVFASSADATREADLFVQVRPGVLLAYETPRMVQELTAEVEALEFVRNSDQPSVNYHAGYRAKFDPTPRSSFTVLASGTTGQLSQLSTRTSPDMSGVMLTPPGKVDVRASDASISYSYQLTPDSRLLQSTSGRFASTNDNVSLSVTSLEAGATLGVDKSWRADALGFELGVSVLHLTRLGPVGDPTGIDRLDQQLNPRATVSWRHDLDKHWSTSLTGGVVMINPYGTDPYNPTDTSRTRQYLPVLTGTVAYADDWGRALVTAGRAVTPNLFIAENTITDSVVASAAIPLVFAGGRRREAQYLGAASLGFAHTQLIDDMSSGSLGSFDIVHGDVGVAWTPRPGMAYGLRYEYFRQIADSSATSLFAAYSRSTIFATFAVRWPEQITVDVPRRSQSMRADRSDLSPVGEEEVVPDGADGGQNGDKRGQGGGGNQGGNGTSGVSGNSAGTSGSAGTGTSGGVSGGVSGGGGAE